MISTPTFTSLGMQVAETSRWKEGGFGLSIIVQQVPGLLYTLVHLAIQKAF